VQRGKPAVASRGIARLSLLSQIADDQCLKGKKALQCGREAAAFFFEVTQEHRQKTACPVESKNVQYELDTQIRAAASRPHCKKIRATARYLQPIPQHTRRTHFSQPPKTRPLPLA
jgi:hypothetical protein